MNPYTHLFIICPHLAISLQEHTQEQEMVEREWLIPGNTSSRSVHTITPSRSIDRSTLTYHKPF